MWWVAPGHQRAKPAVNTSNARAGVALTLTTFLTGAGRILREAAAVVMGSPWSLRRPAARLRPGRPRAPDPRTGRARRAWRLGPRGRWRRCAGRRLGGRTRGPPPSAPSDAARPPAG